MTTKDKIEIVYWSISLITLIATIYVIYYSPIKAVKIGRQLNDEQNADRIKRELFLRLFALRGKPIHQDFVDGLNQINVVFHDDNEVLTLWKAYFQSLKTKNEVNQHETWERHRTSLLSKMATNLGYKNIDQMDVLENYFPEEHQNQFATNSQMRSAEYNFYLSGNAMHEAVLNSYLNPHDSKNNEEEEEKTSY